jgi:hypothetical protein
MFHDTHHPDIAVRASRRAGSKVRHAKPLALLLSGLILIGAVAPATADPAGDGKTKSSTNLLEQMHEMIVNSHEYKAAVKAWTPTQKPPSPTDGKYVVAPRHQMQPWKS